MLLLPRRLARLWVFLAPTAGLALQTLVVYASGLFGRVAGTDAYGYLACAVPVSLLVAAAWRQGRAGKRRLIREAFRCWPVFLAQLVVLIWLVLPMAEGHRSLTSLSIGSCDAADYGAGTRVFQEFAADDRGGFLGDVETVQVGNAGDFRTFWLQLNHFTPVAAMALFASVAGLEFHQVVSLFTAALPALALPAVALLFRSVFRFERALALLAATALAASPLLAYAVYHVAPAQLLALLALATMGWAVVKAFEVSRGWRGLSRWAGATIAGAVVLLGSYNFFVFFALAPLVPWCAWRAWRSRRFGAFGRWCLWLLLCALATGALLPDRVLGLVARFQLFETYDFGWRIPLLRPDGWLGALRAPSLAPGGLAAVLTALAVLAWTAFHLTKPHPGRRASRWALVAFAGPPLAGYAALALESVIKGNNATYDAYKWLSVFLPFVFAPLLPWMRRAVRVVPAAQFGRYVFGGALVILAFSASRGFHPVVRQAPLVVDRDLPKLREIEEFEEVDAVNMRVEDFWSRLWANAFLLRKAQDFATHTYEGRRPTALEARFDLTSSFIRQIGPDGRGPLWEGGRYQLVDRRPAWRLEVTPGQGWYPLEFLESLLWRWSGARPELAIQNSAASAIDAYLTLSLRAEEDRDLLVLANGAPIWKGRVGRDVLAVTTQTFALQPGSNLVTIDSPQPPTPAPPGDPRLLLVMVFGFTFHMEQLAAAPSSEGP